MCEVQPKVSPACYQRTAIINIFLKNDFNVGSTLRFNEAYFVQARIRKNEFIAAQHSTFHSFF